MAQFITTLFLGTLHVHLCHAGQRVFCSQHYMTGGVMARNIIYREGRFRDAREPDRVIGHAELCSCLGVRPQTRFQSLALTCHHLATAWTLPLRRRVKRHWNPWLE